MEQLSDEEIDHGAEEDSDKEDQDLDKMFGAWLGELDKLTQSLDSDKPMEPVKRSPLRQETNMANFSYRFSIYNLNEALNQGETVDLDALMADLCSIERELSSIGAGNSKRQITEPKATQKLPPSRHTSKHGTLKGLSSSSNRITKPSNANYSLDDITAQLEQASLSMDEAAQQSVLEDTKPLVTNQHRRTASAGTVSDAEVRSISNSSRSSITSAASSMDSLDIDKVTRPQELDLTHQGQPVTEHAISLRCPSKQAKRHIDFTEEQAELTPHSYLDRETSLLLRNIAGKPSHLLTKEEQAAKLKAEKIRVALEKIKEAQVKKLVIRVHMSDDSSKTMMVDERQTVRQVLDNLMDKSHCGYSLDWSLVETISELQMERIFEDHENLVENLLNWTRDSQNKLLFMERIEKYALFKNPQNYLLGKKETAEMADRNKEVLLEECFCGSSVTIPEIEGVLWLKEDGKKSWKKRYFLLRASGIYYVPKGKAKVSRDLVCFLQLDHVNVYYGQDYRNKYKAPTDYCLVLKHPQIQKKSQYIKYLCCDDVRTLHQWVNGIRIAKYGKQLYMNYQEALKRTESACDWTSLSSSSIKSGSSSSSIPESQSNHSTQSDSGVSDTQPAGHVRSQSIVSSIFSEAWKRGTQLEESSKLLNQHKRHQHSSQLQVEGKNGGGVNGSYTDRLPEPNWNYNYNTDKLTGKSNRKAACEDHIMRDTDSIPVGLRRRETGAGSPPSAAQQRPQLGAAPSGYTPRRLHSAEPGQGLKQPQPLTLGSGRGRADWTGTVSGRSGFGGRSELWLSAATQDGGHIAPSQGSERQQPLPRRSNPTLWAIEVLIEAH
ncbi:ras-associated and pleckstrin homology domains-containing protein 1 isoform 3-T3 [Molossus nigricans]